MRRSARRIAVTAVGGALFLGGLSATSWASGGGGCGQLVSDARGTHVRIKQACFTPTVLHVNRGQAVTFSNLDPVIHNVQGANVVWGSWDPVRSGRSVTYRFVRSGVYPYVCSIHVGMVGAIVVGNGNGPGAANATTTQEGPVIQLRPSRPNLSRASLTRASFAGGSGDDASGIPWPMATFIGTGLFAVAGLALLHLRQQMKS